MQRRNSRQFLRTKRLVFIVGKLHDKQSYLTFRKHKHLWLSWKASRGTLRAVRQRFPVFFFACFSLKRELKRLHLSSLSAQRSLLFYWNCSCDLSIWTLMNKQLFNSYSITAFLSLISLFKRLHPMAKLFCVKSNALCDPFISIYFCRNSTICWETGFLLQGFYPWHGHRGKLD